MTHQLSLVVAIPLIGAFVLAILPGARAAAGRAVTVASTALVLAMAVPLWLSFAPRGAQWQFIEQFEPGGARFVIGVDGFGLVFVVMTAVVSLLAAVLLTSEPPERMRRWGMALLLIEAGALGAFVSLELRLMFLFWQLAVVTLAGTTMLEGARRAGIVMAALILVAAAAMFSGLLVLGEQYRDLASVASFDVREFQTMPTRRPVQMQAFVLLAIGCVMPIALSGIHAWSVTGKDDREASPAALSGILVAALTVFGLLRMMLPVMPQAARAFATVVTTAGLLAAVVAIVMAWRSRPRAAVFWIALGQVALAITGVSVATPAGLTGGTVQVIAAGLTIAVLLPIARRTGDDARSPFDILTAAALIATIAGGFTGARLITSGLAPVSRTAAVMSGLVSLVAGIVLIAVAWRRSVVPVSPTTSHGSGHAAAASLAAVPAALLLAFAVHPAPILSRLETSVARVIVRVSPEYASQVADCLNQPPATPPPDSGLPPGAMLAAPCNDAAGPAADPNQKR